MTAVCRGLFALLVLPAPAVVLGVGSVQAQDVGSHRLWQETLTAEQVRAALNRRGGDEETEWLRQLVRDQILREHPTTDPRQLEDAIRRIMGDRRLMEQLWRQAWDRAGWPDGPGSLAPGDWSQLLTPPRPVDRPGPKPVPGTGVKPVPPLPPGLGPGEPNPVEPAIEPGLPAGPGPMTLTLPDLPNGPARPPMPFPLWDNPRPNTLPELDNPRARSLAALAALWERHIGPLDDTPEVKKALFDLLSGDGLGFDLKDPNGTSIWDLLQRGELDPERLEGFLHGRFEGGSDWPRWRFPKLDLGWGRSDASSSRGSNGRDMTTGPRRETSTSTSWDGSGLGLGDPLKLVLLAALALLVGYWLWHRRRSRWPVASVASTPTAAGTRPVDPQDIQTRADVVRAFEYWSVRLCGPAARNWTHATIAGALVELARVNAAAAHRLARLYELARYAPADEPLTPAELAEARLRVGELAGVET